MVDMRRQDDVNEQRIRDAREARRKVGIDLGLEKHWNIIMKQRTYLVEVLAD